MLNNVLKHKLEKNIGTINSIFPYHEIDRRKKENPLTSVYHINSNKGEFYLKVCPITYDYSNLIQNEILALNEISRLNNLDYIFAPEIVLYSTNGSKYNYLLTKKLGEPFIFDHKEISTVASQLAILFSEIHSITSDKFGYLYKPKEELFDSWVKNNLESALSSINFDKIERPLSCKIEKLIPNNNFLDALYNKSNFELVHQDVIPRNLRKLNGKIALIDWNIAWHCSGATDISPLLDGESWTTDTNLYKKVIKKYFQENPDKERHYKAYFIFDLIFCISETLKDNDDTTAQQRNLTGIIDDFNLRYI